MLNNKAKIIIGMLLFFTIFICSAQVNATTISQVEYTEEYKKWLELPEDERNKIIAPKMFDLDVEYTGNRILTKIKTLMNSLSDSKYDLRDKISNNLKIRNQKRTNACWTFATLSSLETNLALQNNSKVYDFSESHMDYSTSQSFTDGKIKNGFSRNVSLGGNFQIGAAYLTNGQGAVLEKDLEFIDTMEPISINNIKDKNVVTKVIDTEEFYTCKYLLGENITEEEFEALVVKMKEHIKENGAISAGIHGAKINNEPGSCYNNDTGAIYCKDASKCKMDHNVSIIGWDDEYAIEKFNQGNRPNKKGAWIIRNSWGEEKDGMKVGDNGFMYVSYEDINIYTQLFGIEKATENIDYDNIYQYNELGYNNLLNAGVNKIYIANVFNRDNKQEEELSEVALNVMQNVKCKVYVNPNGDSKDVKDLIKVELKEGNSETFDAGYHTIEFKEPIKLTSNKFTVVIEVEAVYDSSVYCTLISKTTNNFWDNVEVVANANYITYGEFFEENQWIDTVVNSTIIKAEPSNLSIKAFTRKIEESVPTPTPTASNKPTVTPTVTPTSTPEQTPTPTASNKPTPTSTIRPTQKPTAEPTGTVKPTKTPTPSSNPTTKPTLKPTSPIITNKPTTKPTSAPSNNSGILGSINTNTNNGGSTLTSQSSLPYVGKTKVLLGLIAILFINIIIVYKKYKKIY